MNGTTLPQQLQRMDMERLRAYADNLAFYQGQQWLGVQRRRDRRLTFNYARALVEKTTSYLMSGTGFAVDPGDPSPEAGGGWRGADRGRWCVAIRYSLLPEEVEMLHGVRPRATGRSATRAQAGRRARGSEVVEVW